MQLNVEQIRLKALLFFRNSCVYRAFGLSSMFLLSACGGRFGGYEAVGTDAFGRTLYRPIIKEDREQQKAELKYWEEVRIQNQIAESNRRRAEQERLRRGELVDPEGPTALLTRKLIYEGDYGVEMPLEEVRRLVEEEGADPAHCLKHPEDGGPGQGPVVVAARYLRCDALDYLLERAPERAQPALASAISSAPSEPPAAVMEKVERVVLACVEAGATLKPAMANELDRKGYAGVRGLLLAKGIVVQPLLFIESESEWLPDTVQAETYRVVLVAGGGDGLGYEWSARPLPKGLSLAPASGELMGSPEEAGRFRFKIEVVSHDGQVTSRELGLRVIPVGQPASYFQDLDSVASARLKQALVERRFKVDDPMQIVDGAITDESRVALAGFLSRNPMVYAGFYDSLELPLREGFPNPGQIASMSSGASTKLILSREIPVEVLLTWLYPSTGGR